MKKIIFGDESGDLGFKGSKHFVYSIIIFKNVNEYNKLEYLFKKIRRHKFKKYLKNKREIKGYKSLDELIFYLFKESQKINYQAYSIVLNKNNENIIKLLKCKNNTELYLEIITELFNKVEILSSFDFKLDRFPSSKKDFSKNLLNNINKKNYPSKITLVNSENWKGIQFADLIAWSTF